jgi:PAS domain S-box-containing protein
MLLSVRPGQVPLLLQRLRYPWVKSSPECMMSGKSDISVLSPKSRFAGSGPARPLAFRVEELGRLRAPAAGVLVLFALALITLIAVAIDVLTGVSVAAFGWLYLLVILPVTLRWGRLAGLLTAAAALLLLLTFLTEPRGLPYTRSGVDLIRLFISMGGLAIAVFLIDQVNRRLVSSDRLLAAIAESADDAVTAQSANGTILAWNSGAEQLYGYTAEEALGHSIAILTPPDRLGEWDAIMSRLKRGEQVVHLDSARTTKDGRSIEVSLTFSAIRDSAGRVTSASTIARDVTARRQIESALQANEDRLLDVVEQFSDGLILLNGDGKALLWNRAATHLLPGLEQPLPRKRVADLLSDRFTLQPAIRWQDLRKAKLTGSRFLAVDMSRTPLSLRAELTPIETAPSLHGPLFILSLRDATVEVESAYRNLRSGDDVPVRQIAGRATSGLDDSGQAAAATQSLTAREAEVLALIARGQTNQGIADELGITVNTVERHIANLYRKLQIRSRAQATAYVLQQGVGSTPNGSR